jgi:predicted enzyme related to lactoylglutathione lyase
MVPAKMKHAATWFEIPASDLDRAATFYEAVLETTLWRETVAGVPHAIFPVDDGGMTGAVVSHAPTQPGSSGVVVYLACDDIQGALRRAQNAGGEVVMPATSLDKIGLIAAIKDLDQNTVGLHEP